MPETPKVPKKAAEPAVKRRSASQPVGGTAKVPAHKKIYGAENDVIDTVVQSVKRDSAQRNNRPDNGVEPVRRKAPAARPQQRRATSGKSFEEPIYTQIKERVMRVWDSLKRFRAILAVFVGFVLIVSAAFLDSQTIDIIEQKLTIYGLAEDLRGLRILHLSDLNSTNFGDEQAQLMRRINTIDYDIVVLTGDMVGSRNDAQQLYKLLDALPSSKPVYFIAGDADPGPFVDMARDISGTLNQTVLSEWILGAISHGAIYVDRPVSLRIGSSTLWFTPADMLNTNLTEARQQYRDAVEQQNDGVQAWIQEDYEQLPFTSYRSQMYDEAYKSAASMSDRDLHISLSHVPPSASYIAAMERGILTENADDVQLSRPDLILAGHYCNGVWRLPVIGALHVSSNTLPRHGWFPARNQVSGLSYLGDTPLYVNGGLSTNSATPLMFTRVLNHPQISVITLTGEMPESMLGD